MLTFAFGLIHGFGFASVLRDMGVGGRAGGVALPLFSFNLGVELGQIAVAAIVLPIIWQLRKRDFFVQRGVPACSAIVALAFGIWGTRPNVKRVLALGREVAGSGGPPSPEQAQQIARIQRLLKILARVSLAFIGFAALCMAAGRYL